MGISGLERSKFVFLPVLVVKRFGICQLSYYCKRWSETRALNQFCQKRVCFLLYCMLKNLVASVEIQSFQTEVFSGWGLVLFLFFSLQFLGILTALANTNKISFGLLFPLLFVSQTCYRNSCLIVVRYLKISLNAELELFSVSLNYWSNLVWHPE